MTDQEDETKRILSKIGKKKKKRRITVKAIGTLLLLSLIFTGIYQLTNRTVNDIHEISEAGFPKTEIIKQLSNIPERPLEENGLNIETSPGTIKGSITEQTNENIIVSEINGTAISKSSLGYTIQEIEDPETGLVLEKVIPDEQ